MSVDATLPQDWRSIILYGRNVATYKFALGQSLLDLARDGHDRVTLEDLAIPYSRYLCEHVAEVETQTTSRSSRFLSACVHYNRGAINTTELISATVALGFNNVIDAFHTVDGHPELTRFYVDERSTRTGGLRLTDELLALARTSVATDLHDEVGTRWHLVERTWESKQVDRQPLVLAYERLAEELRPAVLGARRGWAQSVRPALNGYQRGFCFYCYRPISVLAGGIAGSHVDHLHPHAAIARGVLIQLDDVWNLVLACTACNLSKGPSLPSRHYLEQLHARNEWLIGSHHPLRESVIAATGRKDRWRFLQRVYDDVAKVSSRRWEPEPVGPSPFTDLGALKVE